MTSTKTDKEKESTMTTSSEAKHKPEKRPHSTNPKSPRYRSIVPTKKGALACAICGDYTPEKEQTGLLQVEALGFAPRNNFEILHAESRGGALGNPFETIMTRCPSCAARRGKAERLAELFPGAARTSELVFYGSAAVEAIERVLAAIAATGGEVTMRQARHITLACKYLLKIGGTATWRVRFSGVVEHGVNPSTAAAGPWTHLSKEERSKVTQAFRNYLQARVERPIHITPAEATACFMCGIGSIKALPSRANTVWHTVMLKPESLGGKVGTPRVETEVCQNCFVAFTRVQTWGPSLLDTLVLRAAGVEMHGNAQGLQLNRVKAWGTSGRRKANSEPFAHVNLEQLANDVRSGVFG